MNVCYVCDSPSGTCCLRSNSLCQVALVLVQLLQVQGVELLHVSVSHLCRSFVESRVVVWHGGSTLVLIIVVALH